MNTNGLTMIQSELEFAIQFARDAGAYMVLKRNDALTTQKLDRTVVTDIDKEINTAFIELVRNRFGDDVSVIGEESSARKASSNVVWVIDPIDGTGEYIDAQLADSERTSCVGIAMFEGGVLRLSVVFNPFRNELFVANRALGTASLNGERLDLTRFAHAELAHGMAYDYCYWDDATIDARIFEGVIGTPPLGSYSAINQACDVARGKSAFAVFPGDTIHDIAPGALLVELAGGAVSPLQWDNLGAGAVYAVNPNILASVINYLSATTS